MSLHIEYCQSFGITLQQLEQGQESLACYAYSRYILDIGTREDWFALQMALAPCLFGYIEAAKLLLADDKSHRAGNPYWKWVENYSSGDFAEAVENGRSKLMQCYISVVLVLNLTQDLIESHIIKVSSERLDLLIDIFITATKMECHFWDDALKQEGRDDER